MELTDENDNKENMDRFMESDPNARTECSGIADKRMQALREQQRQEILRKEEAPRVSKSEESMDVDMDMDECCALPPIQEKKYAGHNDNESNFAKRLDQSDEKMECSFEDDSSPSKNDVKTRSIRNQHSNFAEGLKQDAQYDFYVVDTCVYIDALEGIKELLMYCLDANNHSVVVVPYQVLQEFDHLKEKKPELFDHVDAAVTFIRNNLESERRAIKAQHTSDYIETSAKGLSGDDSIIGCALQLREQVPNLGTITLVSHDGILRTKAVAAKLGETTINSLLEAPSQYSSSVRQQQQHSSDMYIEDWKLSYDRGQPVYADRGKDIPRFFFFSGNIASTGLEATLREEKGPTAENCASVP